MNELTRKCIDKINQLALKFIHKLACKFNKLNNGNF